MLISDPAERAQKSQEKRRALLRCLRDETWSVADVLAQVAGVASRQAIHKTLMQMEREELIKRHSLPVRLTLRRDSAQAELQLGDAAKFFPSDAALAGWMAQADGGSAQIVYDAV